MPALYDIKITWIARHGIITSHHAPANIYAGQRRRQVFSSCAGRVKCGELDNMTINHRMHCILGDNLGCGGSISCFTS